MMNNGKETTEQEPNSWKELWAEGRHETLIDANHLFDVCGPVFGFPFAAAAAASLSLSLPPISHSYFNECDSFLGWNGSRNGRCD